MIEDGEVVHLKVLIVAFLEFICDLNVFEFTFVQFYTKYAIISLFLRDWNLVLKEKVINKCGLDVQRSRQQLTYLIYALN